MPEDKLYTPAKKSAKVNLHSVMDTLGEISKLHQGDDFWKHMKANDAAVIFPSKTYNLIKSFIASNGLHNESEVMSRIVAADPNNPNHDSDCCNN